MSLELLILGSGAATFAYHRNHTAQILTIQGQQILIDCGEGTQLLMKRYKIKISKIDRILISHLHGDHYLGLTGLLSTMHLFGRKNKLLLIGPPGLKEIIKLQLRYSETVLNFQIQFIEFTPGKFELLYDHLNFTITGIPMNHRIPCSGYFFEEKPKKRRINQKIFPEVTLSNSEIEQLKNGKNILNGDGTIKYENKLLTLEPRPSFNYAFFSDTKIQEHLKEKIKGADLLYHEATFADDMEERATKTYHTTAKQAAQFAKDAAVGKLILGHFSARYKELDPIIDQAKCVFPNTELAIEGTKFTVNEK